MILLLFLLIKIAANLIIWGIFKHHHILVQTPSILILCMIICDHYMRVIILYSVLLLAIVAQLPAVPQNAADTLKATNKAQLRVRVRTLWKRDEIWGSKGGRAEQNCLFFRLFSFFFILYRKFQKIAQPYYYKIIVNIKFMHSWK